MVNLQPAFSLSTSGWTGSELLCSYKHARDVQATASVPLWPPRKLSLATPTAQPAVHVEHEVILIDLGLAQSVNLFTECAVSSDHKLMMWSDARPLMPFISNDLVDWVMKNNNNNSDWCAEPRQECSALDKTRALPFSQMVCSAF